MHVTGSISKGLPESLLLASFGCIVEQDAEHLLKEHRLSSLSRVLGSEIFIMFEVSIGWTRPIISDITKRNELSMSTQK